MRSLLCAALVLFLNACPSPTGSNPEPGALGPTGATGPTGADGQRGPPGEVLRLDGGTFVGPQGPPGSSVGAVVVDAGTVCPAGGVRLARDDGGTVAIVCNGAPGPTGASGQQGLSVVPTALSSGDAVCAYGGSKFVVGLTTTYACNGTPAASDGGLANPSAGDTYSFAGFTTATLQGNLGGIVGANAACNTEFPGAHLCTYREYQWTGSPTAVPAGGAWVDGTLAANYDNAFPRDRSGANTCTNWTVNSASAGGFLNALGVYSTAATACQTARSLTCCRSSIAVFRGTTSSSFDGNLGGVVGANAKCNAQFAGSHFCNGREYQWAGSPTAVPAGGAWVDEPAYSVGLNNFPRDRSTSTFFYCCTNWSVNSASYGNFVDATGITSSSPTACATPRPLFCCGR
jgi:hypothetical protein